jgi:hypothetical protein
VIRKNVLLISSAVIFFVSSLSANAALITFDDVVFRETSYGYDGDGDGVHDVIFSTTDASGFSTICPFPNQSYINHPCIEGTTLLSPDLRVDFLFGASDDLGFGFANNISDPLVDGVSFSIFDSSDVLLASTSVLSDFTLPNGVNPSSFPEGLVGLSFAGIAAYATFDFSDETASRYIIDNFTGTFGSTEAIPVPASIALLGLGLAGLGWSRRKKT